MELLERDDFLGALDEYLGETHAAGRFVFVAGEAGIGKTTLVRRFAADNEKDVSLAWGACDGLYTPRPLGPLYDIAADLDGDLERSLAAGAGRDGLFSTVLATLRSLPTPFLVVFEDIHWADEATLDLLRVLGRRVNTLHGLLIATYRDDELGPAHAVRVVLGDLATSGGVRRMTCPPFLWVR